MNTFLNLLMAFGSTAIGGWMLAMAFSVKREEHGWRAFFYTMAFLNALQAAHFFFS